MTASQWYGAVAAPGVVLSGVLLVESNPTTRDTLVWLAVVVALWGLGCLISAVEGRG